MKIGLGIGLINKSTSGGEIPPINTVAPVISGTAILGSTLSCTTGTWTGSPNTFIYGYQWRRNGVAIIGANSNTYITTVADSTAVITCVVTANNCGIALPSNTVAPAISGTAVVGQTLTTANGTWNGTPLTYDYRWFRGTTQIGTNSNSYTLVASDAGQNITCIVTANNSAGSTNATSNALAIIDTVVQKSGSASAAAYDINMVLNSSYANYSTQIVRVRRSGDNAEANYGVASNGYVDWSAITAYCVAGGGTQNGFVVTIYDQSGNARNMTQTDPAKQMQVVSGGTLLTDTGAGSGAVARAAMRATGTQFYEVAASTAMFNFLHNGADGWILGVQRLGVTSDPNALMGITGNSAAGSTNIGFLLSYDDRVAVSANNRILQTAYKGTGIPPPLLNTSNNDVITANQTAIINAQFDVDNATLANRGINWINNGIANTNNTSGAVPVTTNATFNLQWGSAGNGTFLLTGSLQRLIIWNANLSTQRTTLTTLTNSYYGAY